MTGSVSRLGVCWRGGGIRPHARRWLLVPTYHQLDAVRGSWECRMLERVEGSTTANISSIKRALEDWLVPLQRSGRRGTQLGLLQAHFGRATLTAAYCTASSFAGARLLLLSFGSIRAASSGGWAQHGPVGGLCMALHARRRLTEQHPPSCTGCTLNSLQFGDYASATAARQRPT